MISDQIIHHSTGILAAVDSNLFKAVSTDDREAYHDLRVSIKRLRALLKILLPAVKKKKTIKSIIRQTTTVFKAAGKVRDMQVCEDLAGEYENLTGINLQPFRDYLGTAISDSKVKFRTLIPADLRKLFGVHAKKMGKKINAIQGSSLRLLTGNFIESRLRKITKRSNEYSAVNLHRQRKNLKELRFTFEMLNETDSVSASAIISITELTAKIKTMEDLLGTWHDYAELKKAAGKFVKKSVMKEKKQVAAINSFCGYISSDIVKCLDEYYKTLAEFRIDFDVSWLE